MRNRELAQKFLEKIKIQTKQCNLIMSRGGTIQDAKNMLKAIDETVSEIESIIDREPRTHNETLTR